MLEDEAVIVVQAATLPEQKMEPQPALLILHRSNQLLPLPEDRVFPESHIPILVISDSPIPPAQLMAGGSRQLIDFLAEPVNQETLIAKIRFLLKVGKMSMEHKGYLQSHDTFLDWFTSHDGLTGLYNRHHFNKTFQQEFKTAQEGDKDLSLLILDIDYFNELNRTCGHQFGDFVLNELSARLTRSTRKKDICFRFTGGDFIVLMPKADLEMAKSTAEEIRQSCLAKPFNRYETSRKVTVSIGIASTASHHPTSGDELVNMAESALYAAKADGRNRCYVYRQEREQTIFSGQGSFDSLKLTIGRLLERTRKSAISSLQILAREIAGEEHRVHIDKVSWYTALLGKKLGLTPPVIETLQNAVIIQASIRLLMHNDLISRPVQLDEAERRLLNDLPYKIAEITEVFSYFDQERNILLTRSERYDGSGLPDGLKGNEIPLGARIINIVDSFAAMAADRPFRTKMEPSSILNELKTEAGRQFDPLLVLKLLALIEEKELLDVEQEQIEQIRDYLIASYPKLQP